MSSKNNEAAERDAQRRREVESLTKQRLRGPPDPTKYPGELVHDVYPIVEECALFVPLHEFLPPSAETLGDARRDDKTQATRLSGVATFLQMVTHPLAGKVTRINSHKGTIHPSHSYNMVTDIDQTRLVGKVEMHMVLMLYDETRPASMNNVAGILFRAMVRDYDFSFSDALYLTILTNQYAQNPTTNTELGQASKRVLALITQTPAAKEFVDNNLSRVLVYDIIRRPERYRRVLLDWAKVKRLAELEKRQTEEIAKARSKRAAEVRAEQRKQRSAAAAAAGGDPPAQPPAEHIDEATVLTPAEEGSIKARVKAEVEVDPKIGINAFLNALSMNMARIEGRAEAAESIVSASASEFASMCVGGRSVKEPSTHEDTLDVACFQTNTLIKFVEAVYANALEDTEHLRELSSLARSLDASGFDGVALAKSALDPRKVLTLRSQLDMAHKYGADVGLCDPTRYYCAPKDPHMPGAVYDPTRVLDTVSFLPNDVFPDFGRTPEQRAEILGAAPVTEERLAPYFGCSPGPALAYTMPRDSSFEGLRSFRLPFAESTVPSDIDKAYKAAMRASSVERQIVFSAVGRMRDMMDDGDSPSEDGDGGDVPQARTLNDDLRRLFDGKDPRDRDAFKVDMQAETDAMAALVGGIGHEEMLAQKGIEDGKKMDARNTVMRQQSEAREARMRELHFDGFVEPPSPSEIGTVKYYRSNYTMMRERLTGLANKMNELSYMDPPAFARLMPQFREYCLRATARVHMSDAYNNGSVMRGVRTFDRENWHDTSMRAGSGAFMRRDAITCDLSRFGNCILGDMIALRTMANVTVGTFLLTDMLAARYVMGDNTATAKLNVLLLSRAGDGKSRLYGIFGSLCVPQTVRSRMVQSLQAGVDAQASDDHLDFYDEAPAAVSHAGRSTDPVARLQENILRTTTGTGQVSGARSCHGDYTVEFVSDSKNTVGMASNVVERPPNFELSMHSRFEIRRLPDEINTANQMLYDQHKKMPPAMLARKRQLETYFRNYHALQLLAAKAQMMYGLPPPDTTVVSCFLGPVMERVERYYPRWMEAMRASNRVMLRCRGYAVYNALQMVFGSPFSLFAPENNPSGYNPGFDVMHLAPCAPFMCATVEMLMMSTVWSLEEAVCTEMHKLMYALATSAGFTAKSFEHLFVFGGPDHRDSPSVNTARNTRTMPTGEAANVTPVMRQAAEYGRRVSELSPAELLRRQRRVARVSSEIVDGRVLEYNCDGEVITEEMETAMSYEMEALDFYTAQSAAAKNVLLQEPEKGSLCYAIGGWRPEHWGRTFDEMPEFWKSGRRQLAALERRNNQDLREEHVISFAPNKTGGTFNPNYIRVMLDETRDLTAAFERALGSHSLSRVNVTYMMNLYASDARAVTMELPQLASCAQNSSVRLQWLQGSGNLIVTRKIPVVAFPKNHSYIDISTVWLFCGAYHNHLMSMYTFFEDKHVPDGGHNMLLPLQNAEAPELLYSFRLRPNRNRVITVSNPEYTEPEIGSITSSSLPARECESTYFSMMEEQRVGDAGAASAVTMADSMSLRVATAALNAINHGPMREHSATMTIEERRYELELVRWKLQIDRINAPYIEACKRADANGHERPSPPVLPPRPQMRFEVGNSSPLSFFAANKQMVTFDAAPIDEQLQRVFFARTGQNPRCTPTEVEAALAANTRAVGGMITSHAADLKQHVTNMIVDGDFAPRVQSPGHGGAETNPYQSLDDDGDDARDNAENSDASVNVALIEFVSRLQQASNAMSEFSKHQQRAIGRYPDAFISKERRRPEWIMTDMRDAPINVLKDTAQRRVSDIGPIPIDGSAPELDGMVRVAFVDSSIEPVGGKLPDPINALSLGELPPRMDDDFEAPGGAKSSAREKSTPVRRPRSDADDQSDSEGSDELPRKDAARQGQAVANALAAAAASAAVGIDSMSVDGGASTDLAHGAF